MRRTCLFMLVAVLLTASLFSGAAAEVAAQVPESRVIAGEADAEMAPVSVPEQGFSTRLPAGCSWDYTPDGGLTIRVGAGENAPWVRLFRTEAPGSEFDARSYFDNVFTPQMRSDLGGALLKVGSYASNNIAGIEMPGVQYTYLNNGRLRKCLCMYDLREDGFVRYEARYYEEEQDACLLALALAAVNYQPIGGGAPDATQAPAQAPPVSPEGGLKPITCAEMGFETACEADATWKYTEGQGVYIYPAGIDDYSFAFVHRSGEPAEDAGAYLRQTDMPFWKAQFGDDFISYTEYERYPLAGRALPAMVYAHDVEGSVYEVLRVLDERDGAGVMFSAQYPRGGGDVILAALETAAEHYRTLSQAAPQSTPEPVPQSTPEPAPPSTQPSQGGEGAIDCPQQGFATLCEPGCTWQYRDGDGVYIYVEEAGYVPFAHVSRAEDVIADGLAYIRDVETPLWQESFGKDLVDHQVYEAYAIAGRTLPGALYTHRSGGYLLDFLRLVDARPDGVVYFTAHYIQGEGEAALRALETAVANFTRTSGGLPAPAVTQVPVTAPEPTRDTSGLMAAECPELGFSTLCESGTLVRFAEKDGLYL
ncbi:MAG: hypothetical protein IJH38_03445, partial [Clostridia bacterium]|nr:hypothetical protein [Clostridia bacterium]